MKETELELLLCSLINENINDLTLKQLEIVMWALSKRLAEGLCHEYDLVKETSLKVVDRV